MQWKSIVRIVQLVCSFFAFVLVSAGTGGDDANTATVASSQAYFNHPELQFLVANGVLSFFWSAFALVLTFQMVPALMEYETNEPMHFLMDGLFMIFSFSGCIAVAVQGNQVSVFPGVSGTGGGSRYVLRSLKVEGRAGNSRSFARPTFALFK